MYVLTLLSVLSNDNYLCVPIEFPRMFILVYYVS
jgi:hypothetical protein